MLKNDSSHLDYGGLVKVARRMSPSSTGTRIAILADVSTQHLVPVLRACFHLSGLAVQIHEGDYDTIEVEAFDPSSSLYGFQPEFVCILQSTEHLKRSYYDDPGNRSAFAAERAGRIEAVWRAIIDRSGARVIQSTFVIPMERPFGNYGLKVGEMLQQTVADVNREMTIRAAGIPGVLFNDVEYLASWIGRRQFVDERLWALTKSLCALEVLPNVAQNIVDIVLASLGRTVKCVVLDLDNTVWGGVVAEDGIERLALGDLDPGYAFRHFQHFLRDLSRRGVILTVCSKNDEATALSVFREHPDMVLREEDIAVFVANWDDKAMNIRRIRDQLNIGFDSMVFLDDNPFERNLVRQLLPEVIVPELPDDPVHYVRALSELNLFETASSSALDANRTVLYHEASLREEERDRFEGIEAYLRSLETVASVKAFEKADLPRIAQLIERSNQFNLTTRRHSEAVCATMMTDRDVRTFTISLSDRFGKFGLILVAILRKTGADLEIDSFLMSCRVLQRGVEQFAMNRIFEIAGECGAERVVGRYIPTAKNGMVERFFEQFGFTEEEKDESGAATWSLGVEAYSPREVFIRNEVGQENVR